VLEQWVVEQGTNEQGNGLWAGFFGSQEWAGFGQFRVLTGLLLPSRGGGDATGKLGAEIWPVASSWLPKIWQDLLIRSTESTPVMNDQFSMRIS